MPTYYFSESRRVLRSIRTEETRAGQSIETLSRTKTNDLMGNSNHPHMYMYMYEYFILWIVFANSDITIFRI